MISNQSSSHSSTTSELSPRESASSNRLITNDPALSLRSAPELAVLLKLINWSFMVLSKGYVPKTMEKDFCYGIYFCCAYICKYAEIRHPAWLKRELPNLREAFRIHGSVITNHSLALPFIKIISDAEKAIQPQTFFVSTSIALLRGAIGFVGLGSQVAYDIVARNRQERSLELMRKQYAPTLLAAMYNLHNTFHQFVNEQNQLIDILECNSQALCEINRRKNEALLKLKNKKRKSSEEQALLQMIDEDENDADKKVEPQSSMYRIPSVPSLFQDFNYQSLQNSSFNSTTIQRK